VGVEVADRRRPLRLTGTVADAPLVEQATLRVLPAAWPDLAEHLEVRASSDGFVRVGGVDYSVPPRLLGRGYRAMCCAESNLITESNHDRVRQCLSVGSRRLGSRHGPGELTHSLSARAPLLLPPQFVGMGWR
jgi:hypothetical protein